MVDGWLNILGHTPSMPRHLMMPTSGGKGRYHTVVRNVQEYLTQVEENSPRRDVWFGSRPITSYYEHMRVPAWHERVFGDIDSEDPQDALDRARKYADRCEKDFDVWPQAIFTANKGFHMHFEHEPVHATAESYRDSIMSHFEGINPDPDPLRSAWAMPRLPYSMNLKSYARFDDLLFVVPVDVTWSLEEIIQAAREVRVSPIDVPFSPTFKGVIQNDAERRDVANSKRRVKPLTEVSKSNIVLTALVFSEKSGRNLKGNGNKPDGLKRVLRLLYVPALMHEHNGDEDVVRAACEEYLGDEWESYKDVVESTIRSSRRTNGDMRLPMNLKKFLAQNPDLRLSGPSPK